MANGIRPAFAYIAEGGWRTPLPFNDRLSLGLGWGSGEGSATAPFFPIVREAQSFILRPSISGMMNIKLNYLARLLPSLSADISGCYFIRTDSETFVIPYLENNEYFLGAEFDAGVSWAPFSDLSLSVKGGAFLPQTGNAWAGNAPVLWRITVGMMFSM